MLNAIQLANREHKVTPLKNGRLKIELNENADKDSQLEYRKDNESYGLFDEQGNRVRLRTGNIRITSDMKPLLQFSQTNKNSVTFDCLEQIVKEYKGFTLRILGVAENALLYSKEYKFDDELED